MNKILFINACVRVESRTLFLAKNVLNNLTGKVKEVDLYKENIKPIDNDIIKLRDDAFINKDFSNDYFKYAKDFKEADIIVIAAPYWDLSFPSVLKIYLENICIIGLTFKYLKDGTVKGLCKAKKLIYVATSGGYIPRFNFAFNYVAALSKEFFGITDTSFFKDEGLDIYPDKEKEILEDTINTINNRLTID